MHVKSKVITLTESSYTWNLWRGIELDIRHPEISEHDRARLRRQKAQYIGAILQNFDIGRLKYYVSDLYNSLTGTLECIRRSTIQEPGHPENRVTLELFRLVQVKLEYPTFLEFDAGLFDRELDRFEAWINMGGCAKSPGRLNRDPELCWCSYIGR